MTEPEYEVIVVVDPDFGQQLRLLPLEVPVWIADTSVNRVAAQDAWLERPGRWHLNGVTTFEVDVDASPCSWCAKILDDVVLHHGRYSHNPAYTALQVIGCAPTAELLEQLKTFGLPNVERLENGFRTSCLPQIE